MAIYRRFRVQQKYVNGQPTEEYRLGVEIDSTDYNSLEECKKGSDCTELEYRWVDMESADDYICEGTNKYKKQMKQQKCVTEEAWTNVYPYEYRAGGLIEHDSVDCGYSPTGEYHIYGTTDGHGSINISPSKEYYSSTDVVTITALPSTDYSFSRYNYGRNLNYGSVTYNSVLSLTMSNNWYVSAVFKSAQYRVYDLTTFGGSLTISPSKEYYNKGDVVTINALPSTYYMFSNYSYGSTSQYGQNSTNSTLTLTMSNDWYVRGNFLYESASGGNLYYSYTTGLESWYDWSKSTLASWHNYGSIARIIIDYGGVIKAISSSAFDSHSYLSKIILPNCSYIGDGAFERCTSLTTISFPNCLFIGSEAFNACTSLPSIDLPNCTYVDNAAFANCTSLTSVNLPNCISVSNYAFSYCTSLTTVNLPKATYVGKGAFSHCKILPSIYLPNCSSIGEYALAYCYSLTSVSLPLCKYVDNNVFRDCDSLVSIDLPLCEYVGNGAFFTCTILTSVSLPICSYVGDGAFGDCFSLTYVNLPNCSYVGNNAFNKCSVLSSIDLPLCSYVGNGAFEDCSNLTSISLPLCEYVGDLAFYNCQKISSINLPNCLYVGGAFSRCSILKTIRLPKVTYFNYHVFDYRTPIETLYMDHITSVPSGYDPFIDSSYLKSIIIPCSLVDDFTKHSIWGKYSRYYVCTGGSEESDLKEIFTATDGGGVIILDPEGGKYYSGTTVNIGYSANPGYVFSYFQYGSTPAYGSTVLNESFSLLMSQNWYVSVNFDYGTASSGSLYYSYNTGSESWYDWSKSTLSKNDNNGAGASIIIDYGSIVQTIPSKAFSSHSYLTKIVLPNCTYIGDSAFEDCSVLSSISLPNCSYVGSWAFYSCYSLTSINLPLCSYVGDGTFTHCSSLTSIYLPLCQFIGYGAFIYCSLITSVDLPSCSYVGSQAFYSCYALTSVNLPLCSYVGSYTFNSCSNLTSINLPNCTYVSYGAFDYCKKLTSIDLPLCSYVGSYAFYNCQKLTSINFPLCEFIGGSAFAHCSSLPSIGLPNCSLISYFAFGYCESLTSISLPKCTYVSDYAFTHCSLLTSIYLPLCSYVCRYAFEYCRSLTSVNLPKVTYFGSHVFESAPIETLYMDQITSVPSGYDPSISISYIKSIFIPCSLLNDFTNHSIWSKYSSYFACV